MARRDLGIHGQVTEKEYERTRLMVVKGAFTGMSRVERYVRWAFEGHTRTTLNGLNGPAEWMRLARKNLETVRVKYRAACQIGHDNVHWPELERRYAIAQKAVETYEASMPQKRKARDG